MRRILVVVGLLCIASGCDAWEERRAEAALREFAAHTPNDLDDAMVQLDSLLSPAERAEFREMDEDDAVMQAHFGLGLNLRNGWGLWAGSPIREYFLGLGVSHPDDMSSVILVSYHRYLRGEPVRLDEQLESYGHPDPIPQRPPPN